MQLGNPGRAGAQPSPRSPTHPKTLTRPRRCRLAGWALALATLPSWGAYVAIEIPGLGGSAITPLAVNGKGQVTGAAYLPGNTQFHAFLYSDGMTTDLGALRGASTTGLAINDAGQVVGYSESTATVGPANNRGFVYGSGGLIELSPLGGAFSLALGINNAGQVIGVSSTAPDMGTHSFIYSGGVLMDIGPPGRQLTQALAVNARGQVTGYTDSLGPSGTTQAFLYGGGSMKSIGPAGSLGSSGNALNDKGQVVGAATLASGDTHAFLYDSTTSLDLGTLGGAFSWARDINGQGWVVGESDTADGARRAFLYHDGAMQELELLGGRLSEALAVDDDGRIFGRATTAADDRYHYYLYEDGQATDVNDWLADLGIEQVFSAVFGDGGAIAGRGTRKDGSSVGFLLMPQAGTGGAAPEPATVALLLLGIALAVGLSTSARAAAMRRGVPEFERRPRGAAALCRLAACAVAATGSASSWAQDGGKRELLLHSLLDARLTIQPARIPEKLVEHTTVVVPYRLRISRGVGAEPARLNLMVCGAAGPANADCAVFENVAPNWQSPRGSTVRVRVPAAGSAAELRVRACTLTVTPDQVRQCGDTLAEAVVVRPVHAQYEVSLDAFTILHTRAQSRDTVYVALAADFDETSRSLAGRCDDIRSVATVGRRLVCRGVARYGTRDLGDGTYATSSRVGIFEAVPGTGGSLRYSYVLFNFGFPLTPPSLRNEMVGTVQAAMERHVFNLFQTPAEDFTWELSGPPWLGCDGPTAAAAVRVFNGSQAGSLDELTRETGVHTVISPVFEPRSQLGCGPSSKYSVQTSVRRTSWRPTWAGAPSISIQAQERSPAAPMPASSTGSH